MRTFANKNNNFMQIMQLTYHRHHHVDLSPKEAGQLAFV